MNFIRCLLFSVAVSLLFTSVVVTPAAAQKRPEKIKLTAASKNGAVLIRVGTINADYKLWFQKSGSSGFGSRVFMIDVDPGDGKEVFVARTLSPGRYRLDSLWQQNRWGMLLSSSTVEFEVKPGTVTYIGTLNAVDMLLKLQQEAIAAGKTVSIGTSGFSTDKHGMAPMFSGRDNARLAEAVSFASRIGMAKAEMVELGSLSESRGAIK